MSPADERVPLEDRVVIVTGAGSGLGRAYATALAQAGARLVVVGRRRDPLLALVAELAGAAVPVIGDVAEPAVADRIVETATSSFGRLDALVNNAGGLRDRTLLNMSDSEFDEVIRAHVYGTFYVSRACARAMRAAGGGTIVNIGSDSGLLGAFGQSNYAAAKGAILGLTLTWARELRRYGITCNCVLPNALTAMTENLPELLSEYRYGPPEAFPRSMGEPSEVAPLIVLLITERWRCLTGRLLSVGGDRLSLWQPPSERRVAFLHGGWSLGELDRSLADALGLERPAPPDTDSNYPRRSRWRYTQLSELTARLERRDADFRWRGQVVKNVTEHPDFKPTLLSWGGWLYRAAFDPETAETMVARPDLNGEDCHIFWHMATSAEDLLQNLKAAQLLAERSPLTGYASIGRDELHALMCATQDIDQARGTDYHRRVLDYVRRFQSEQLMTAAAVTDVKGNRGLRPAQQDDPDMYLRIVDRNNEGIVVRGAKAHTSGSVGAEELIVIPTRAMRENEGQYAVAFAIPVDAPGITLVARALNAGSDSAWEAPISSHDELAETFTVFNDVFVPHERVFLQGEWEFAGDVANMFASVNRQGYLGTESGKLRIFIGAAQRIAELNGVAHVEHIRGKIAQLIRMERSIWALGVAASLESSSRAPGLQIPDPVLTNAGKHLCMESHFTACRLLLEIAGGAVTTAPLIRGPAGARY